MSYRKSLLVLAFAALGLWLTQVADAACPLSCSGSYTGTSSTKEAPNTDLECEGTINIAVGGLPATGTDVSFVFKSDPGALSCKEVDKLTRATVAGPAPFTLTQETLFPTDQLDHGLLLRQGEEDGKPTWTWVFQIDGTNQTKEVARWRLTPVDGNADFCNGVPETDCTSWQGTPSNPSEAEFPDGVFSLTMVEDNGKLIAKTFVWTPCHNGTFDGSRKNNGNLVNPIVCEGSGPTRGVKFRTDATATVIIDMNVDIEPGQDPNLLNRNSAGFLTVAILSKKEASGDVAVNPATINAALVTLDGVTASGASDLNSDYNEDGINDLTLRYSIPNDLLAADGSSLLKNAQPGDVIVPFRAPSTVGNTVFTGNGTVTIVQPVRVDYRPGCNNQLTLNNPNGSDPVAILGGRSGAFDTVDVTDIDATTLTLGDVVLTSPQIGDVSGTDCGTATADGNADGILDLQLTVDVEALYLANQALFDAAADGNTVDLPVTGQLLNGAPIVGTATVTVHRTQ